MSLTFKTFTKHSLVKQILLNTHFKHHPKTAKISHLLHKIRLKFTNFFTNGGKPLKEKGKQPSIIK